MKIILLGCFFITLCICKSDAKEVRQISRLVPLDDWIDFKNRTRDVKPIDKIVGKLRATYEFVFHKADNISNVGKIIGKAAEESNKNDDLIETPMKINLTDSLVDKKKTSEIGEMLPIDEERSTGSRNDSFTKGLRELEDAMPLGRLEIIDDDDSMDRSFDDETEQLDSGLKPDHTKFHLPYAIAQALLRWLISLYYSTTNPSPAEPKH